MYLKQNHCRRHHLFGIWKGYDLEHLHGKYGTISEWKKIKKYCPVKGWVLNKKDSYKLLLINCEAVIRL